MSWSSSTGWNGRGWSRVAAAAGGTPATFVTSSANAYHLSTSATQTFSGSPQIGDIALIWITEGTAAAGDVVSPGNAGASYTRISRVNVGASYYGLYGRVLNSADVSTGFAMGGTIDSANVTGVAIYRGPGTFALQSTPQTVSTATVTMPGFAPAALSAGVAFPTFEVTDGVPPNVLSFSPLSAVNRLASRPWSTMAYEFDILSGYSNTAETSSNYVVSGNPKIQWAVEFTP